MRIILRSWKKDFLPKLSELARASRSFWTALTGGTSARGPWLARTFAESGISFLIGNLGSGLLVSSKGLNPGFRRIGRISSLKGIFFFKMGRRTIVGVSRLGNLLGAMEAGARSVCKIPPAAGAIREKSILVSIKLKISTQGVDSTKSQNWNFEFFEKKHFVKKKEYCAIKFECIANVNKVSRIIFKKGDFLNYEVESYL